MHCFEVDTSSLNCYRKMPRIHWPYRITNVEIKRRLGVKDDVYQSVIEIKLNFFGHKRKKNSKRLMKTDVLG